jgi:hypothetical protein
VGALTSHNPVGLHGLCTGIALPLGGGGGLISLISDKHNVYRLTVSTVSILMIGRTTISIIYGSKNNLSFKYINNNNNNYFILFLHDCTTAQGNIQ